ncbi:hypothetical protein [Nocardia sp. NBC_01327]|uniref:hypothetical protein n=1 Tax=Nocardia sp. NBC_01327 TaxID=2903593 RepID=UPI002E134235|nr:hypothetical protein OG326_22905 [Nocardia sp. NBC_01327]
MLRPVFVTAGAALVAAVCAGPAAAQPIFTPEPDGVIKVESSPGEWWKCTLYGIDPPIVRGLPPVVDYPPASWSSPTGATEGTADFATPPAYARFAPGAQVVADCVGQYLPILWLEQLQAGPAATADPATANIP